MESQQLGGFKHRVIIIGGQGRTLRHLANVLAAPQIMDIRHLIVKELEAIGGLNIYISLPHLPQIRQADLICISPKFLAAISPKKQKRVMRKKGKYF